MEFLFSIESTLTDAYVKTAKLCLRSDASSAAPSRPRVQQPTATLPHAPIWVYAPLATGCRLARQGKIPIGLHVTVGQSGILKTPLHTDTHRLHLPPRPTRRHARTSASMATMATRVLHAPWAYAPLPGSAGGRAGGRVETTQATESAHSPALPYRTLSLPEGQSTWTTARFSASRPAFTPRQARGCVWHATRL